MATQHQWARYENLDVDVNVPYQQAYQHIFGWLIKCMRSWNVYTEESRHPKIVAAIFVEQENKQLKTTVIKIQLQSEGRVILSDSLVFHERENYLSEVQKWSSFVMLQILHFGIANLILLTPIHKN